MKTRSLAIIAVLVCTAGPIVGLSGCAGGPLTKSTGEYIDDATLTAKVKAALLEDPSVSGLAVNVDTFKGVVQLNGFVDTAQQKSRAEHVARTIPGVTAVQNKLTVKTAVSR